MRSAEEYSAFWQTLQNFLKQPPFDDLEDTQTLSSLMGVLHPLIQLEHPSEEILLSYLTNPDEEVQRLTRLAISLLILSEDPQTMDIANRLRNCENNVETRFHINCKMLATMNEATFQALRVAIEQSKKLVELSFLEDSSKVPPARMKALFESIQKSTLSSLSLYRTHFNMLLIKHPMVQQAFCAMIRNGNLIKLNLGLNTLVGGNSFLPICAEMSASKLREIDLQANRLEFMTPDKLVSFCALIENPNLRVLKLDHNDFQNFELLNPVGVIDLFIAIQNSTLTHLSVRNTKIFERIEFVTALQGNITLTHIDGIDLNLNPQIDALLQRNKRLATACLTLESAIAKLHVDPQKKLTDEEIKVEEQEIVALSADAILLLQEWRTTELREDIKQEVCMRIENLISQYAGALVLVHNPPIYIDALLHVLPKTAAQTIALYSAFFEARLMQEMNSSGSARKALVCALGYCLDGENHIVQLNENGRKILDAYLRIASGQDVKLHQLTVLTESMRFRLLQILILQEIQASKQIDPALLDKVDDALAPARHNDLEKQLIKARDQLQALQDGNEEAVSDLLKALIYTLALSDRIYSAEQFARDFEKICNETNNPTITDAFLEAFIWCADDDCALYFSSEQHMKMFDIWLQRVVGINAPPDSAALSDTNQLALLRYLVLRESGIKNLTLPTLNKLTDLSEEVSSRIAQYWQENISTLFEVVKLSVVLLACELLSEELKNRAEMLQIPGIEAASAVEENHDDDGPRGTGPPGGLFR